MHWALVSPAPLGRNDRAKLASEIVAAGHATRRSDLAPGVAANMLVEAVALGAQDPSENNDGLVNATDGPIDAATTMVRWL